MRRRGELHVYGPNGGEVATRQFTYAGPLAVRTLVISTELAQNLAIDHELVDGVLYVHVAPAHTCRRDGCMLYATTERGSGRWFCDAHAATDSYGRLPLCSACHHEHLGPCLEPGCRCALPFP